MHIIRIGTGIMGPAPGAKPIVHQIVGLVKNTKYQDLREDFPPIAFLPVAQNDNPDSYALIYIRSKSAFASVVSGVNRTVAQVSPAINLEFSIFKNQIRESLLRERLMASLSGFFGALATVLATIGIYGTMSYTVARRRNEIGIRMALGGDRRNLLKLVLQEAASLVGIGLPIGVLFAVAIGRSANPMLFGLRQYDPASLLFAIALLAAVALAASYLPALRATKVDPMTALRDE